MYTLFCPECDSYLLPFEDECICSYIRPEHKKPRYDGWINPAAIGGPARGAPLIRDDMVIFSWSDRRREGGVTALDRYTGKKRWSTDEWTQEVGQIENGTKAIGNSILWGTRGRLPSHNGFLFVVAKNGVLERHIELPGSVWSKPVWKDNSIILVTGDGSILKLDGSTYKIQQNYSLGTPGWFYVLQLNNSLFIFLRQSDLFWHWEMEEESPTLVKLPKKSETIAEPVPGLKEIFVPTNNGLMVISPGTSPKLISLGKTRLNIPPLFANSKLHFVGNIERLIIVDSNNPEKTLTDVKDEQKRSFVSRPKFGRGLIAAITRERQILIFRGDTGKIFAKQELKTLRNAARADQASVGFGSDYWYIGDWDGNAFAIPWHMGEFVQSAEWLESRSDFEGAADLYSIAGDFENNEDPRRTLFSKAISLWEKDNLQKKIAYFLERYLAEKSERKQIAQAFQSAGRNLVRRDTLSAAFLLLKAANWFEYAGMEDASQACRYEANKVARGPHISFKPVSLPKRWIEKNPQTCIFDLKNIGSETAYNIRIRLTGDLDKRIWLDLKQMHPNHWGEIEIPLLARCPGEVIAEIYFDNQSGEHLRDIKRYPILAVEPFKGIIVDEGASVAYMKLGTETGNLLVKGDIGLLKYDTDRSSEI
jgi:hypothetical protein